MIPLLHKSGACVKPLSMAKCAKIMAICDIAPVCGMFAGKVDGTKPVRSGKITGKM
jgi:hypothetical protein